MSKINACFCFKPESFRVVGYRAVQNVSYTIFFQRSLFIINDIKLAIWSSKAFHTVRRKMKPCRLAINIRGDRKLVLKFKSSTLQHHSWIKYGFLHCSQTVPVNIEFVQCT